MLENYNKTPVKNFRGLYRRGTPEEVPKDHFVDSRNLSFKPGSFGIRPGSSARLSFGTPVNDIAEWVNSLGQHLFIGIDSNGTIWLAGTPVTSLYNIPGATNFATAEFFGRLFICPTNIIGPVGNLLMLYDFTPYIPMIKECGEDIPISSTAMVATINASGGQTGNNISGPSIASQLGSDNIWQNPNYINLQDSQFTTVSLYTTLGNLDSNLLQITGFDFSAVPDNSVILGIEVEVYHKQISGTCAVYDTNISLLGVPSSNLASGIPWNNSAPETFTYGGATNLWGNPASTLGGADINSQQFGLAISVDCTSTPGSGAIAGIDYVSIKVYWQTTAGKIAIGTYNINVVYETETGFLTPPASSPNIAITANVTGDTSSITLTNVPLSPSSHVIARYIIIAMQDSLGDVGTYFFIPSGDGGVINDNTTTSTTLSFFITDLVESADYLFNLRARIPAGQGINVYAARLVLLGFPQPDASILRLSNVSDPETFDQTLETIVVSKDDGYYVTNTASLNDLLYIWKNKGIRVTNDNGNDPVNWSVDDIDDAVGCGFRGLSTVSPTVNKGSHSGIIIFADTAGAYLFNGYVINPELTYMIEDLWQTITDVTNVSCIIDIKEKRVFFFGFTNGELANLALVMDFSEGISHEKVKWDIWTYFTNCRLLTSTTGTGIDVVTILPTGVIIKLDKTQYQDFISNNPTVVSPIYHYAITAGFDDEEDALNFLYAIVFRVIGVGLLHVSAMQMDDEFNINPLNRVDCVPVFMQLGPGQVVQCTPKFEGEKYYLMFASQIQINSTPPDVEAYFIISRLTLYSTSLATERPQ
jgi:hypothetical protein